MNWKKLSYWKKGILLGIIVSIIWTILQYTLTLLSMGLMFADDIFSKFVFGVFWIIGLILSSLDPSRIIPESILHTFYSTFYGSVFVAFIFRLVFFVILGFIMGLIFAKIKGKKI